MVRGRKGQHQGGVRRRSARPAISVPESMARWSMSIEPPELSRRKATSIEAVIDRIVIREGIDDRLAESIRARHRARRRNAAGQLLRAQSRSRAAKARGTTALFSTLYACPNCKISYEELEPRTFSFNSPYGACPTCEGLGARVEFDPELVLPDMNLSLADGPSRPGKTTRTSAQRRHKTTTGRFSGRRRRSAGTHRSRPGSRR